MTKQEGWAFSRYTPDDAQDSLQLARSVWGEDASAHTADQEWQYQRSPAGAAIGALARETQTGRLIGQVITLPVRVMLSGRVRFASLCLHPAIDPAYEGGSMLSGLLDDVFALSVQERAVLTYGLPSQAGDWPTMEKAGLRNIGAVPLLLRPLNPERLATKTAHGHPPAKAASSPGASGGQPRRRSGRKPCPAWRSRRSTTSTARTRSSGEGSAPLPGYGRQRPHLPQLALRERPRARVQPSQRGPKARYGAIVLRVAPLGQFSAGLIVELVVEASAEGSAAGRLLIYRAYSSFKGQDLDLLANLALRLPDEQRLLRSMGFWVCPKFLELRPFRFFVRSRRRRRAEPPGLRPDELVLDDGGLRRRVDRSSGHFTTTVVLHPARMHR
jgi:hypothetical protein